ncbi:unnamed protein product, partial [Phaeothamnion confervicola]
PEAGVQLPAGTMEAGETPEDAVLREAFEETGLAGLRIVRFLGRERIDLRPFGKTEGHDRWFFLLALADEPDAAHASAWERVEETPAAGGPPVRFLLQWTPLAEVPPLIGGHDRFLGEIAPDRPN